MTAGTPVNAPPRVALDDLELKVFLGLSLDGCIAGENDDLSWLAAGASESPAATGYLALMASVDTVLVGRRTYDAIARFDDWPFDGKQVRVLTSRPLQPRNGERACSGPLPEVLLNLWSEGARRIYVDGGNVVRQALALDLVNEMTLSWLPVVLGRGIRLFDERLPVRSWELVASRQFASGMVQARYRRPFGQPE